MLLTTFLSKIHFQLAQHKSWESWGGVWAMFSDMWCDSWGVLGKSRSWTLMILESPLQLRISCDSVACLPVWRPELWLGKASRCSLGQAGPCQEPSENIWSALSLSSWCTQFLYQYLKHLTTDWAPNQQPAGGCWNSSADPHYAAFTKEKKIKHSILPGAKLEIWVSGP